MESLADRIVTAAERKRYEDYLKSPEWLRLRALIFERDEYTCQRCGIHRDDLRRGHLEVHHLTYEHLFEEDIDDLVTLCTECHLDTDEQKRIALQKAQDFPAARRIGYPIFLRRVFARHIGDEEFDVLIKQYKGKRYIARADDPRLGIRESVASGLGRKA